MFKLNSNLFIILISIKCFAADLQIFKNFETADLAFPLTLIKSFKLPVVYNFDNESLNDYLITEIQTFACISLVNHNSNIVTPVFENYSSVQVVFFFKYQHLFNLKLIKARNMKIIILVNNIKVKTIAKKIQKKLCYENTVFVYSFITNEISVCCLYCNGNQILEDINFPDIKQIISKNKFYNYGNHLYKVGLVDIYTTSNGSLR